MSKEKPAITVEKVATDRGTYWMATRDGYFHAGWGKTKDDAIKDLLEWECGPELEE